MRMFPPPKILRGFTLLELVLVLAIIAILAGIIIVAINPARQFAQARNAERRVAVNTILNAIYQYRLDNRGVLPSGILVRENITCAEADINTEMCQTGAQSNCQLDISEITNNAQYLSAIPVDPLGPLNEEPFDGSGSGYSVYKNTNNIVTVCAPHAELGEVISATR